MLCKSTSALIIRGERIEKNTLVEATEADIAQFGSLLEVVKLEKKAEPVQEEEKDIESMSKSELVELADSLGLETDGTKADLVERIKLYKSN